MASIAWSTVSIGGRLSAPTKFLRSFVPSTVRKLSGWYWTPSRANDDVADAHDLVLVGPGDHLERVGQRPRPDHQAVVAGRLEGVAQAS